MEVEADSIPIASEMEVEIEIAQPSYEMEVEANGQITTDIENYQIVEEIEPQFTQSSAEAENYSISDQVESENPQVPFDLEAETTQSTFDCENSHITNSEFNTILHVEPEKWTKKQLLMASYLYSNEHFGDKNAFYLPSQNEALDAVRELKLENGLNQRMLKTLSLKLRLVKKHERPYFIMFDEFKINESNDGVNLKLFEDEKLFQNVLIFFAASLQGGWKIPLAYYFNDTLTTDNLSNYIEAVLHATMQCDKTHLCGLLCKPNTLNLAALQAFGALFDGYFVFNKKRISVIFDTNYLIEITRNLLLVYDIKYNKKTASWKYIEEFFDATQSNEISSNFVLSKYYLKDEIDFEDIKSPLFVFNNDVAELLQQFLDSKHISEAAGDTIDFIKFMARLAYHLSKFPSNEIDEKTTCSVDTKHISIWKSAQDVIKTLQLYHNDEVFEIDEIILLKKYWLISLKSLSFVCSNILQKRQAKSVDLKFLDIVLIDQFKQELVQYGNVLPTNEFATVFKSVILNYWAEIERNRRNLDRLFKPKDDSTSKLIWPFPIIKRRKRMLPQLSIQDETFLKRLARKNSTLEKLTKRSAGIYIAGYLLKKIITTKKIKNCPVCLNCLLDKKPHNYVKTVSLWEYRAISQCAVYPNSKFLSTVIDMAKLYVGVPEKDGVAHENCFFKILKANTRFNWHACQIHKSNLIDYVPIIFYKFFMLLEWVVSQNNEKKKSMGQASTPIKNLQKLGNVPVGNKSEKNKAINTHKFVAPNDSFKVPSSPLSENNKGSVTSAKEHVSQKLMQSKGEYVNIPFNSSSENNKVSANSNDKLEFKKILPSAESVEVPPENSNELCNPIEHNESQKSAKLSTLSDKSVEES